MFYYLDRYKKKIKLRKKHKLLILLRIQFALVNIRLLIVQRTVSIYILRTSRGE